MTDDTSISSAWLKRLANGDDSAVAQFLAAYGPALERIAADRMSPALQRRVGPDDVFQSVCRTFFRRARDGQFQLPDGDALWRLLCAITLNKVRGQARRHGAIKRGGLRDKGGDSTDELSGLAASQEISPEEAIDFADQLSHLMDSLGPAESRLLQLKLDGHSHAEIAEQLNCTERTVGRLLVKCQTRLATLLESEV